MTFLLYAGEWLLACVLVYSAAAVVAAAAAAAHSLLSDTRRPVRFTWLLLFCLVPASTSFSLPLSLTEWLNSRRSLATGHSLAALSPVRAARSD